MDDSSKKQACSADEAIEQEIRLSRKYSAMDAVARMAGPGAMKGASPVSPVTQAETAIGSWCRSHVVDAGSALQSLLPRHLKGSELLLANLDQPLVALEVYCKRILDSDNLLQELVREVDVEWGQRMDERPYFQKKGAAPHPDDPYTVESVRAALSDVLDQLEASHRPGTR
jgi:hypothetical protein